MPWGEGGRSPPARLCPPGASTLSAPRSAVEPGLGVYVHVPHVNHNPAAGRGPATPRGLQRLEQDRLFQRSLLHPSISTAKQLG